MAIFNPRSCLLLNGATHTKQAMHKQFRTVFSLDESPEHSDCRPHLCRCCHKIMNGGLTFALLLCIFAFIGERVEDRHQKPVLLCAVFSKALRHAHIWKQLQARSLSAVHRMYEKTTNCWRWKLCLPNKLWILARFQFCLYTGCLQIFLHCIKRKSQQTVRHLFRSSSSFV